MWLAVLGPLLVHDGETPVDVPRGRQRVLLAALMLHAGSPVAAGALAEVVWDGSPPSGAAVTLRSHVLRLRRVLGPRAGARLVTRQPGYLLQAGQDEVDVLRFRGLCRDGGTALREGDWDRADGFLGEALALWRGPPLTDVPSELLREEAPGLEELRLQAEEWRTDAALHLGRHDQLVTGLQFLTAQHPLRERFHAQLMLALYRCGRQAEALAAYQHARHVLIQEVGAEPGPQLQQLHQQVLSADPALTEPEPALPTTGACRAVVPRELPPGATHFTGRTHELACLTELLDRPHQHAPGTVVISAIGGTAGVGKTALAVCWGHQVMDRFPDGQLYVDLRGYDPARPVSPADALARFLRSLGVLGQDIPAETDERAARYRSLVAGRRMLIVLDNAGSAEQVRPLLPGVPACTVLVTSRDTLAGLVARDGADRLELDLLPLNDAVRLLRALAGDRIDAEPGGAQALADQCCRLPLALRVAAELAASRPAAPLSELITELRDHQKRLDLLDAGQDPRTAVRAVFSWSYQRLDPGTAHSFRMLALHPSADFDLYAAASITGTTQERAASVLDLLARAHLIQFVRPGRYGMHDLLRAYACECAADQDAEEERRVALTRLFDYYLHTVAIATETLYPAERSLRLSVPSSAATPPMTTPDAALAWLDAERATFVAVAAHAAAHGWPRHAINLATILLRYLDGGGHYPEAVIINILASRAARHLGDSAAEAEAARGLARVDWRQGRYQKASRYFQRALALSRQLGDQAGEADALIGLGNVDIHRGRYQRASNYLQQALARYNRIGDQTNEARVLGNLAIIYFQQGRYQQAGTYLNQGLVLCRQVGNQTGEARCLSNLSVLEERQGRYQQATAHLEQALSLYRTAGDRSGEAYALSNLGLVKVRLGRFEEAATQLQQALLVFRSISYPAGEASTLANLGAADQRQGRYQQAHEHYRHALTLCRRTDDRSGEARALNGLGEVLLAEDRPGHARLKHTAALELARQVGDPYEQARAWSGLARSYHLAGDLGQARHHWQEALTIYDRLGVPETDQLRAQLAGANGTANSLIKRLAASARVRRGSATHRAVHTPIHRRALEEKSLPSKSPNTALI
jgi:DNA-binding SARP family transcriptional activator/tetratricopeptide (TPR) repeat protein